MKFIATHKKTITIAVYVALLAILIGWGCPLLCMVHAFRIATTLYPKCSDARIAWAESLYQNGQYRVAMEQLNIALRINSNDHIAHQDIGNVWFKLGQYEKAKNEFAQAVQLAPKDSFSLVGLGSSLYKEGHYDDAITHLNAALRIRPNDSVAQQWLKEAKIKKREAER